ncbi:hypothetical protein NDU88_002631 [Pleurodeles waltl]|uniref:Uncharacterized protein n=1 Tax=Pleurodeles waltl TaxID=8319 RepID=A0AAV7VDD1_PLEWA|nr:hypothetical protein NDU88_002631 [Pleurodeles waltl]
MSHIADRSSSNVIMFPNPRATDRCRSVDHGPPEELQLHFTVAGGRGAEHCALPSGPRKNYPTFTGPRR